VRLQRSEGSCCGSLDYDVDPEVGHTTLLETMVTTFHTIWYHNP